MEKLDLLALAARNNCNAFRSLLEASRTIIEREVLRYSRGINEYHKDEYYSEAITALYESLSRFDPDKGSFSSYASRFIDQAILDYMRNKQGVINIGSTKINEIRKLNAARSTIKENGLEESEENLMKYSGISSRKTLATVKWAEKVNGTLFLDESMNDDNGATMLNLFSDGSSFEDDVNNQEEIRALYRSISTLPDNDRYLIAMSYGLYGRNAMSNKELASILHVSENTIVNRKKAIRAKLRILMEEWAA